MEHDGHHDSPADQGLSSSTSLSLVAHLKSRQPAAWERLVRFYGPLIYHWARQGGLSSEDAADVVQDVLQSVWAGIGSFRADRDGDTLRGWLRTITRHKVLDHFRARGGQPSARGGTEAQLQMEQQRGPAPPSTMSYFASRGDHADLVQRALGTIQPDFSHKVWQAFVLTTLQNRSSAEAGAELSMSRCSKHATAAWNVWPRSR